MNEPGENPLADVGQSGPPKKPMNWLRFALVLLLPPVLTLLTSLAGSRNLPGVFTLLGSPVAGLICGIDLARHVTKTTEGAVLMSLLLIVIFTIVIFMLSCAGCAVGGYSLDMR